MDRVLGWIYLALLTGCATFADHQDWHHEVDTLWCVGACMLNEQEHNVEIGAATAADVKETKDNERQQEPCQ